MHHTNYWSNSSMAMHQFIMILFNVLTAAYIKIRIKLPHFFRLSHWIAKKRLNLLTVILCYKRWTNRRAPSFQHAPFPNMLMMSVYRGHLHCLVVACWTTNHYHPYSNLSWAYLKVVSSVTLLHYLWRLFGPFNLACETNVAVKYKSLIISQYTVLIDGIY